MRIIEACLRPAAARLFLAVLAPAAVAAGAEARTIEPYDFQQLSPICQAVFGKDYSRNVRLQPFADQVAGYCGIHHTCNGELYMIKYRRLMLTRPGSTDRSARGNFERQRKGLLGRAAGEFHYEIKCAPPTYPLLPMIHTERGKALSLLGRYKDAMQDFSRALELDPGYSQAQVGLAQARAKAALAR
jgi:tetratricopeptide (TPR) repeat protein